LKLPGLDQRDVQLTKRQYFNITAATSTRAITMTTITTNNSTVTTITTKSKGIKVKFSGNFGRESELNHITPSVCRLSKGDISNFLGTVWCVKLKLTGLVVGGVELTKRRYLHFDTTFSTLTTATTTATIIAATTTATKTKAGTINSTTTIITTGTTTMASKAKGNMVKNFGILKL
jgi:hypothetical protein